MTLTAPALAAARRDSRLAAIGVVGSLPPIVETWMHDVLLAARGVSLPDGFASGPDATLPTFVAKADALAMAWRSVQEAPCSRR